MQEQDTKHFTPSVLPGENAREEAEAGETQYK